ARADDGPPRGIRRAPGGRRLAPGRVGPSRGPEARVRGEGARAAGPLGPRAQGALDRLRDGDARRQPPRHAAHAAVRAGLRSALDQGQARVRGAEPALHRARRFARHVPLHLRAGLRPLRRRALRHDGARCHRLGRDRGRARARRRAHHQPRAALQRAGGRAPRPGRPAVEGDARAHPRRTLRRNALPAGGARRDARRLLRVARLGRRRRADGRAPGGARASGLRETGLPYSWSWSLRRTLPRLAAPVPLLVLIATASAAADPVTVRFPEGTTHGFLVLRSLQGQTLAHGELLATPHGDRMESRLTWRFRDGSLQDELVTYLQKPALTLLSYKQIQRGPSFPADIEVAFTREPSRYEVKQREKRKKETEELSGTLELPADVYNGMTMTILKNLTKGEVVTGHVVAFFPKPRLVKTSMRAVGDDPILI